MKPGEYNFNNFITLLEKLKDSSPPNPYWMVVQTCEMDREGGLRYPTPEELRLMVYLSLAHNGKGIFFFLHNSYTQQENLLGLVDIHLKPYPIYSETARLAHELKILTPTLLDLSPRDTILKSSGEFDVQTFSNDKGEIYVFVINMDVLKPQEFMGIADSQKIQNLKTITNVLTGEAIPFATGNGNITIKTTLEPGSGSLLKLVQ